VKRSSAGFVTRLGRGVYLCLRHALAEPAEFDAIDFLGEIDLRLIAVAADIGDDRPHRLLDVLRGLALGGEKRSKARSKVRGTAVEAYRHDARSRRGGPGKKGQWPARAKASTLFGCLDRLDVHDVDGASFRCPGGPEVGKFGLKAFDLEPQRRAAGERQRHHTGRQVGRLE